MKVDAATDRDVADVALGMMLLTARATGHAEPDAGQLRKTLAYVRAHVGEMLEDARREGAAARERLEGVVN